ncbi:MAG: hypothetical protein JXN63_02225 [Candidatus Delongbacteria bacterium]|nr:hypothetical protein [Candidatus Delongbacteria bacterium]
MSRKPPDNNFFINGETIFLAKCIIAPDGLICKIRNTGTSLDGVNLYIDSCSVDDSLEIIVSLNTGYIKLGKNTIYTNPVLDIHLERNIKLKKPLKIAIPITGKDAQTNISCFFIKDDRSLSPVISTPPVIYEDKISRFIMYTFHSGLFTWIN